MTTTTIGRVRVRANAEDALAVRMRGEAALRALELEPPGMPPQAILCVRTLDDPMPGAIDLRSSFASRANAWERAARTAIADALRRAVRPALGFVPAAADAVYFADRAELLACLARDACRGALDAWWWTHLARGVAPDAVVREWLRTPEYVAAAYALLAARREATPFVRLLASHDATALAASSLHAHGAEAAARALHDATFDAGAAPRLRLLARTIVSARDAGDATMLGDEQRIFTAVAAACHAGGASTIGASVLRILSTSPAEDEHRDAERNERQRRTRRGRIAHADANGQSRPHPRFVPPIEENRDAAPATVRPDPPARNATAAPPAAPPPAASRRRPDTPPLHERKPRDPHDARATNAAAPMVNVLTSGAPPLRSISETAADASSAEAPPRSAKTATPSEARADEAPAPLALASLAASAVESQYAGVFFLVNVALALELYDPYRADDFRLWDFIAGTAHALVPSIVDDDVWGLLAELAGREPGSSASGPGVTPTDREGPGARVAARHPRNPPSAPVAPQPASWALNRRPSRSLDDALLERVNELLATLLPDVDDPAAFLIRRYGRIIVTPAHLDVSFSLAVHPIEIRMSGLDRNPGWIPAAGLHVAFHFD